MSRPLKGLRLHPKGLSSQANNHKNNPGNTASKGSSFSGRKVTPENINSFNSFLYNGKPGEISFSWVLDVLELSLDTIEGSLQRRANRLRHGKIVSKRRP